MATYVCADLHGFYDAYMDMMDMVGPDDMVYIIGDVIDRGSRGIDILLDVMGRANVVLIKGNHEHMMRDTLGEICYSQSLEEVEQIIESDVAAISVGQEETLRAFSKLTYDKQQKILNFIDGLPFYMEVEAAGKNYVLVHGGLPDFEDIPLEYVSELSLLFGPHDYDLPHYEDTTVLLGHTPTRFLLGAEEDRIFRSGDSINLDCGLGFGGQLGVLCLETEEEFYF